MARPCAGITFWDRVYAHTQAKGECILFIGHRNEDGYGRIFRNKKLVFVHREVWARDNGSIPPGRVIMHTCDQPNCIQPKHLVMGTQVMNIKDMDEKGRRRALIGSQHRNAVLLEKDIPVIRNFLNLGKTCASIARMYNVSEGLIRHIKKGRIWRHVKI